LASEKGKAAGSGICCEQGALLPVIGILMFKIGCIRVKYLFSNGRATLRRNFYVNIGEAAYEACSETQSLKKTRK
jgi:hypothetical protein